MKDTLGIENALTLFPDQLKEAWGQAYGANLPQLSSKNVVISGMGGSSLAGRIIAGIFEEESNNEIVVYNDYGLPAFITKDWVLIANSYSGNTEETLSAVEAGKKLGMQIIGIATAGKIGEMIGSGEIQGVILTPSTNPSNYPKSALGVSLGGLAGLMAKMGLINLTAEQFNQSVDELIEIRKSWDAKSVASNFTSTIPVLIGSRPLLGSVHAGRNVINEIGRTFAVYFDLPELDHHLVEATGYPKNLFQNLYYLFLESDLYNERVKTRINVTIKLFDTQKLKYGEFKLQGKSRLTQSLEIPHFCAWIALAISFLNGEDPGPEPWIIELKEKLSQTLH
ncbi:MAG: SIS domain-containing protein [Candidatus Woesebacteria bacterium]|nr:SIS domain-containing protein [Candidatus Woesebacteria bacterium]